FLCYPIPQSNRLPQGLGRLLLLFLLVWEALGAVLLVLGRAVPACFGGGGRPAGRCALGFWAGVACHRGGGAAPTSALLPQGRRSHKGAASTRGAACTGFVLFLLELGCYLRGWAGFCFCSCLCGRPALGASFWLLGQALP